jgi:hypothetical protein
MAAKSLALVVIVVVLVVKCAGNSSGAFGPQCIAGAKADADGVA